MSKELRFKVSEERTELLPMGVYRRFEQDADAQMNFIAHFMVDDDGYLVQYDADGIYESGLEQAWQILDPLPLRKIREIVGAIQGDVEETAVPKA